LYNSPKHELSRITEGDAGAELSNSALGQSSVKDAAAVLVFSAVYERTTVKYGKRGLRYVHMEAGHAAQNVCLQAVSLNLGTVAIGAFLDEQVKPFCIFLTRSSRFISCRWEDSRTRNSIVRRDVRAIRFCAACRNMYGVLKRMTSGGMNLLPVLRDPWRSDRTEAAMGKIVFEKISSTFTILNPFNNFAAEEHRVEVRKDPLLGDTSIHNPYLKDKAKAFFGQNDPELVQKLAEESARNCIFCGRMSCTRPPDIRLISFPKDGYGQGRPCFLQTFFRWSVSTGHRAHQCALPETLGIHSQLIADGVKAAQEFLRAVYLTDASAVFAAVCANYLFPAGASLVHPHLQMLVTPMPYSYHARMLNASHLYYEKYGSSYFDDLLTEEKRIGERFAQQNRWYWLAAFSPMGSNEIVAIHEKEADFGMLSDEDLRDLSHGISKVLLFYERLGLLSFNFTLFSVRQNARTGGFRCVFEIISRQNLYPNYRNDDYFLQKMLQSELIFNLPEELAQHLKKIF
jgi:hypothetical protein